MKMIWESSDVSKALNVNNKNNFTGNAVNFNSSAIKPKDIFIALKNGNSDGHIYVKDAIDRGASFCIVDNVPENLSDSDKSLLLLVDNTFSALELMAIYKRSKYKEQTGIFKKNFIAITGSAGKTSTKEALKLAIGKNCYSNFGNFNNHIGMPLALASMGDEYSFGVFELGMNHSGEISKLSKILQPNISIITNVSMAHIGNFNSVKDIAEAKSEIFDGMIRSDDSAAILPIDNDYYEYLNQIAQKNNIKNILTFGKSEKANSRIISYEIDEENFANIKYLIFDRKAIVRTKVTGLHHAINNAAVLMCAYFLGLNLDECIYNLEKINNVEGRGDYFSAKVLGKSIHIIDDSYNANPESVKASLVNFKNLNFKNKAIVLSDMLELGRNSSNYHENLVDSVLFVNADLIVTVGEMMEYLHKKIKLVDKNINAIHFKDYQDLKTNIKNILMENCTYLFKGSKGTKLRTVVESIKNNTI
jgi:UDP-N-acetylmuramoyl-tripeptide--D-alanyl-D-alanine ligase